MKKWTHWILVFSLCLQNSIWTQTYAQNTTSIDPFQALSSADPSATNNDNLTSSSESSQDSLENQNISSLDSQDLAALEASKDLPAESTIEALREAINTYGAHPLDRFQLLRQGTSGVPSPKAFKSSDIKIVLKNSKEESIGTKLLRSYENFFYSKDKIPTRGFDLVLPNQFTHHFFTPIKSLTWNANYIVWESDSLQAQRALSFIDLNFIKPGSTELPIFTIPLLDFEFDQIQLTKEGLELGGHIFSKELLKDISRAQQSAFSLTVNLLDMDRHERSEAVMGEFFESYRKLINKHQNASAKNSDSTSASKIDAEKMLREIQDSLSDKYISDKEKLDIFNKSTNTSKPKTLEPEDLLENLSEADLESMKSDKLLNQSIDRIARQYTQYSSLKAKWNSFVIYLSVPRPDGANSIKASLLQVASGFKNANQEAFVESFYKLYSNGKIKISAALAISVFLGTVYPGETAGFLYQSLDISKVILNSVWGQISDLGYLTWEATKSTFRGFSPETIYQVYVADGKLHKTLVGLHALVVYMFTIMAIPHLSINSIKLAMDLSKYDYTNIDSRSSVFLGALKKLSNAFINRQNKRQEEYLENLRAANAKDPQRLEQEQLALTNFTEQDNIRVQKYIELAKKRDFPNSKFSKWVSKRAQRIDAKEILSKKESELYIIQLYKATTNFLFSFASFTNTGYVNTFLWNNWFILRTLVFRPGLWPFLLTQPRFFKIAILAKDGKAHTPNAWNRGTDLGIPFMDLAEKVYSPKLSKLKNNLDSKIIELETKFEKGAILKSVIETIKQSEDPKVFEQFNKEMPEGISDKVIQELALKSKLFLQWYYHLAIDRLNHAYFNKLVQSSDSINLNYDVNWSPKQKKKFFLENQIAFEVHWEESEIDQFIEAVLDKDISIEAEQQADKGILNYKNFLLNFKVKAQHGMDARYSGQFERYAVVLKNMKDPKAMARAVRSSIISMLVDKPMELAFMFLMVAGVSGEFLQPIHDLQFSENSWNYLSKYQFLSGFAYGVISGLLNNVWMKLQLDARLGDKGGFDHVPTGKRKKHGFWRNVLHEMRAKDNSWFANQKYAVKLIWHNMGAAVLTMGTLQYITLGRIDLDLIIAGYGFYYFSPITGFTYKLENAFEKAANWVYRNFPKKYRSHPQVLQYGEKGKTVLKFRFNILFSTYENTVSYFQGTFRSMETVLLGPRSFSRWLTGGDTITEVVINKMDELAEEHEFMEKPDQFCRSVFLNNYTDGINLKNPPK